jgi:ankyrin repeat protein
MKLADDVIQELGRLPATLKESYTTIYNRIISSGPTSMSVARQTFKWILCAQKPLSITELIEVVSIGSKLEITKLSSSKILSVCCNLLVEDTELGVLRFAHLSVREYLEGLDEYAEQDLQLFALATCLDILKLHTLSDHTGFGEYAMILWPLHYKAIRAVHVQATSKDTMRAFLFQGLQTSPYFSNWISALKYHSDGATFRFSGIPWNPMINLYDCISSSPSPLFLSCVLGILWILEDMKSFPDVSWDQKNERNRSALYIAVGNGDSDIVTLLLNEALAPSFCMSNTENLLHKAADGGNSAVVHALINHGSNVHATDDNGRTPLHCTVKMGMTESVIELLKGGAKIDAVDGSRGTVLHRAAAAGNLDFAKLLLTKNADIASRDDCWWTPLHMACITGHLNVVELLLESGSDIESKTSALETPLHLAAQSGNDKLVKWLTERGGNANAKTSTGKIPLDFAKERSGFHKSALNYLLIIQHLEQCPRITSSRQSEATSKQGMRVTRIQNSVTGSWERSDKGLEGGADKEGDRKRDSSEWETTDESQSRSSFDSITAIANGDPGAKPRTERW